MENAENTSVAISQDSKNMGMLIWILSIFFGFIPSLIFFLIKKDDAYIQDQAKEALNWTLTATVAYVAGMILIVIVIGLLIMPVVAITNLVFCIMGAMATSKGKNFRVPFAVRLIK